MNKSERIYIIALIALSIVFSITTKIFAQQYTGAVHSGDVNLHERSPYQKTSQFESEPLDQRQPTSESPSENIEDYAQMAPVNLSELTEEEMSNYTLGKTDVIEISVMRHPEVSGIYIINNEGKIQYEFIGDVRIDGMKKDEVKNLLLERLSKFIISPDVNVKIVGYNSKVVYVIGEVGRPGKIFMRGDTITIREALIQAGLPLLTAKANKSKLITPSDDGHPDKKKVNVHKLLYEGDLRENLVMNPGDTLFVPPTVLTKAMRAISPVAQPVNAGRSLTTGF